MNTHRLIFVILVGLLFLLFANTSQAAYAPWYLAGNMTWGQAAQTIAPDALKGKTNISINYDLHGLCALGKLSSAIGFNQNGFKYISLNNYGRNCFNGLQIVTIPLSDFKGLDTSASLTGPFEARFWYHYKFQVDIIKVSLSSTPLSPPPSVPAPTPPPASTSTQGGPWAIRSIDVMKYTKDVICNPPSQDLIDKQIQKIVELGANYVAISTPYDNPPCDGNPGDSTALATKWINAIRAHGLKVWHRHTALAFEGIYGVQKDSSIDFIPLIQSWLVANKNLVQPGDIFTPLPEPDNAGIQGLTYCSSGVCQFSDPANFNSWLRKAMSSVNDTLRQLGIAGVKVGYFGFSGFTAWGDHNPDWLGKTILEPETIQIMGNITIDHYPENVSESMELGLAQMQAVFGKQVDIIIGEWGTITENKPANVQVQEAMGQAEKNPSVKGFNYWNLGPSANEALINDDYTNRSNFAAVQSFYKR